MADFHLAIFVWMKKIHIWKNLTSWNHHLFLIIGMIYFFVISRFEKLPLQMRQMLCHNKKIHFLLFQLQRNSFQWYHEDSLPMQVVNAVQPLRPQILNDLKNCVTALITTQKVWNVYSVSYPIFVRKLEVFFGTLWSSAICLLKNYSILLGMSIFDVRYSYGYDIA